jgi:putative flippase GtrA
VLLLVRGGHLSPWVATMAGCGVGALVNAVINRYWAFGGGGLDPRRMWRYGFVSASSALLNGGGVALLLSLPGLDFRIAWAICRVSVLLFWNYPINRDYLFAVASEAEVASAT